MQMSSMQSYLCRLFQAINMRVEFVQLVVAVSNDAVQTSDFIVRLLQLFSLLHSVVLVLLAVDTRTSNNSLYEISPPQTL